MVVKSGGCVVEIERSEWNACVWSDKVKCGSLRMKEYQSCSNL